MTARLNRDADLYLADVLSEQVMRTPEGELLAEALEDFGDRRALAKEFDRAFARAVRQTRRRRIADRLKEFVARAFASLSWRPVVATAAALLVVVAAGALYVADNSRQRDAKLEHAQREAQEREAALAAHGKAQAALEAALAEARKAQAAADALTNASKGPDRQNDARTRWREVEIVNASDATIASVRIYLPPPARRGLQHRPWVDVEIKPGASRRFSVDTDMAFCDRHIEANVQVRFSDGASSTFPDFNICAEPAQLVVGARR